MRSIVRADLRGASVTVSDCKTCGTGTSVRMRIIGPSRRIKKLTIRS
jgi:hypothetical protein